MKSKITKFAFIFASLFMFSKAETTNASEALSDRALNEIIEVMSDKGYDVLKAKKPVKMKAIDSESFSVVFVSEEGEDLKGNLMYNEMSDATFRELSNYMNSTRITNDKKPINVNSYDPETKTIETPVANSKKKETKVSEAGESSDAEAIMTDEALSDETLSFSKRFVSASVKLLMGVTFGLLLMSAWIQVLARRSVEANEIEKRESEEEPKRKWRD